MNGTEVKENGGSKDEKKSFGRDVSKLVIGTIIAQAVGICLTPIITRIFSPRFMESLLSLSQLSAF